MGFGDTRGDAESMFGMVRLGEQSAVGNFLLTASLHKVHIHNHGRVRHKAGSGSAVF
jgi:hypothetical protein